MNYPVWNIASKVCTKCRTGYNGDLNLHFHKHYDGYQSQCKTCRAVQTKKYNEKRKTMSEQFKLDLQPKPREVMLEPTTYSDSYVTRKEFDALALKLKFVIELVGKDKVEDLQKRWQLKVNKWKIARMSAQEFANARDICKPALHKIVNDPRVALTTEEEDFLIYEGWHDRDFG